jgi:hypothetical protein
MVLQTAATGVTHGGVPDVTTIEGPSAHKEIHQYRERGRDGNSPSEY